MPLQLLFMMQFFLLTKLWLETKQKTESRFSNLLFQSLYTDIRSQQVPIKTLCTVGHEYTDESQVSGDLGQISTQSLLFGLR